MTYRESIDWLFSTQLFGIKLGLDGPRRLLTQFLAHPAHGVKVIHIAGTNGKGSTCAFIDSVARAAGIRTGLFTSPHLIDYCERIRVSGADIPQDDCARLITEVKAVAERLDPHPTFFELTLAVAMRWFRERECELIILETGMGGRLDATTAVAADVCGITPIGMDHTQWLGDTLEKIAYEKAGIIVEGKPTITAPQDPVAMHVLETHANEMRSPFTVVREPMLGYPIGLPGDHQAWNAALAMECLHAAGIPLNYETVHHGLGTVRWPGRFEILERDDRQVILDGAHNPHAAELLAATWKKHFGEKKAALVFSAVANKDIPGVAQWLAPLASSIHLCPVDTPRVVPTSELATHFPDSEQHLNFLSAYRAALADGAPVLVAGSLFLIGEASEHFLGGTRIVSDQ